ncbi:serine hydrolase [Actinophytocola sediminis]
MRTSSGFRVRRLLIALPLSLSVSCGAVNAANQPEPAPAAANATTAPSEILPPSTRDPAPETRAANEIDPKLLLLAVTEAEPNTTLGAVVVDRVSGEIPLAINLNRQFRSASLVKLLIAIDVLERGADAGDRKRLTEMLMRSDDHIASALWVQGGGQDIVLRTTRTLGLTDTLPPENPGQWGEVLLSAADLARVYHHILNMPASDSALIVDALGNTERVAADGFDQYFGIPNGLPAHWAVKQGWGNNDTAMVLHSTGLVGPDWRYIVVLLTEHPLDSSWQASASAVTNAAAVLRSQLPGA